MPPAPLFMSSPPPAKIESAPLVPFSVSLPPVPLIFAILSPLQTLHNRRSRAVSPILHPGYFRLAMLEEWRHNPLTRSTLAMNSSIALSLAQWPSRPRASAEVNGIFRTGNRKLEPISSRSAPPAEPGALLLAEPSLAGAWFPLVRIAEGVRCDPVKVGNAEFVLFQPADFVAEARRFFE